MIQTIDVTRRLRAEQRFPILERILLSIVGMQEKYTVAHPLVGPIHIDHITGALIWNQEIIDPLIKRYVKRYLFDEGFIEHALGMLNPGIDQETVLLLKTLMDSNL